MSVRIMTYNVHHGTDVDDRPSLDRIAEEIIASKASIVCLQEVDRRFGARSGHADQFTELTDRLAMNGHFGPAISAHGGQYGNAVLADGTIDAETVHLLPTPADSEPRNATAAVISTDLGRLHVISTHLTVGPTMGMVRRRQVTALADIAAASPLPTIVAGDFNTGARRSQLAELEQSMTHTTRAKPWSLARLGLLWGRPYGATFPVRRPKMRIDRIYVRGLRVTSCHVLSGGGSDHRPVVAEVDTR